LEAGTPVVGCVVVTEVDLQQLSEALDEVSRQVLGDQNGEETLESITLGVVELIGHVEGAGISLLENGGKIRSVAPTTEYQHYVDRIQEQTNQGPCFEAIRDPDAEMFEITDMSTEERWPEFARQVSELGVESKLAFVLRVGDRVVGALNVYAIEKDAFTDEDRRVGAIFADHAAMALDHERLVEEGTAEARNLREALLTRDVIGQAKGILMERNGMTADEAFRVLRQVSQSRNVKLRDVAAQIAEKHSGQRT
jgi:GAF domain-containing protein